MFKSHLEFQIRMAANSTHDSHLCIMTKLHGLFVSFVLRPATIKSGRSWVVFFCCDLSTLSTSPKSVHCQY